MVNKVQEGQGFINPHFAKGTVVRGFGRGSKELGIPTANYSKEIVDDLPESFETGIYCGWASVDDGPVHKMVMSIGWNPYYQNSVKSMETHILHNFENDFYDATLKVIIVGWLRPEKNFNSVDELISAIGEDINVASEFLSQPQALKFKHNVFLTSPN